MKRNTSIQLKAAFLIFIFGLNTVVGFACAMGMSFNSSHHHDEEAKISVHIRADEKKHEHHNKTAARHHHEEKESSKKEKDDCCNSKVIKFQYLDKNLNPNAKTVINNPVFASNLSPIFNINILKTVPQKYLLRNFHPPPPDIRVAIQSFQI